MLNRRIKGVLLSTNFSIFYFTIVSCNSTILLFKTSNSSFSLSSSCFLVLSYSLAVPFMSFLNFSSKTCICSIACALPFWSSVVSCSNLCFLRFSAWTLSSYKSLVILCCISFYISSAIVCASFTCCLPFTSHFFSSYAKWWVRWMKTWSWVSSLPII